MKYEPNIDRTALLQRVRDSYALPATQLSFVPVGFAALCYRLHCADNRQYFLKLWRNSPPPSESAPLRLTRAIYERQIPLRVPYPLVSREGALWASFDRATFAIFPWLPGEMPTSVPPPLVSAWASAMAVLHRATPLLAYLLRRALGDMTARIQRLLYKSPTEEEAQDALQGIEAWGFAQWRSLDQTLQPFAAALHNYNLTFWS